MSDNHKRPVKVLRIGLVSASIFERKGEKSTFYNTSFSKAFKDGKDWKYTDSFGAEDLPVIEKLSVAALQWTLRETAKNSASQSRASVPSGSNQPLEDDVPF